MSKRFMTERREIKDVLTGCYGAQLFKRNLPEKILKSHIFPYIIKDACKQLKLLRPIIPIQVPVGILKLMMRQNYFSFNMFNTDDLPIKFRKDYRSRKEVWEVSYYPEIFRWGMGSGNFHFVIGSYIDNAVYPAMIGSVNAISLFMKDVQVSFPSDKFNHQSSTHYIPSNKCGEYITQIK